MNQNNKNITVYKDKSFDYVFHDYYGINDPPPINYVSLLSLFLDTKYKCQKKNYNNIYNVYLQ